MLGCACSSRVFAPRRILGYRLNLPNKVGGVWFGLQCTSVADRTSNVVVWFGLQCASVADGTSNVVEEPVFELHFSDTERLSAAPNNKTGRDLNSTYPRNIYIQFGNLPPPARPPAQFIISELNSTYVLAIARPRAAYGSPRFEKVGRLCRSGLLLSHARKQQQTKTNIYI